VAKFGRGATGALSGHFERKKDKDGNYIKFGNQNIDPERTPENYNLAPTRGTSQVEFICERCSEVKCLKRKDVNVLCSWVVTAPRDVAGASDERRFFEETYKFLENKYGKENVVSAYVHKDEVTPHIHFAFVPVVADRKTGELKVSAKECLTRKSLQAFHGDLSRHLEQALGRDVGILNEATKEGNKSIEELKRGTAVTQLQDIRQKVAKTQEKLCSLEKRVLDANEVVRIAEKGRKTLFGSLKGVSYQEFECLKETAAAVDKMKSRMTAAEKRAEFAGVMTEKAQNELANAKSDIITEQFRLEKERKTLEAEKLKTPDKILLRRNKELRQENEDLKDSLFRIKKFFRDILPEVEKHMPEELIRKSRELVNAGRSRGHGMER